MLKHPSLMGEERCLASPVCKGMQIKSKMRYSIPVRVVKVQNVITLDIVEIMDWKYHIFLKEENVMTTLENDMADVIT